MKTIFRVKYLLLAAIVFTLSLSLSTYAAEPPREEIVHAFRLLKSANTDYNGHRIKAMDAVKAAGKDIGVELGSDLMHNQEQWKSDEKLREARRLLSHARNKLERHDRELAAEHLNHAIAEIDEALRVR